MSKSFSLRMQARKHARMSLSVLVQIARIGKHEHNRIAAAREILDRGYGRAPQHMVDANGDDLTVVHRLESIIIAPNQTLLIPRKNGHAADSVAAGSGNGSNGNGSNGNG